jgi:hypothetical protein
LSGWLPAPATRDRPAPARRNGMVRAHCRGLDHPLDHPDDPMGPVWIRLDRRPVRREQARSVWSRPDRRRAPGYGSGGWGFESLAARQTCKSVAIKQEKPGRLHLPVVVLEVGGAIRSPSKRSSSDHPAPPMPIAIDVLEAPPNPSPLRPVGVPPASRLGRVLKSATHRSIGPAGFRMRRMTPVCRWLAAAWPFVRGQLPPGPASVLEIGRRRGRPAPARTLRRWRPAGWSSRRPRRPGGGRMGHRRPHRRLRPRRCRAHIRNPRPIVQS